MQRHFAAQRPYSAGELWADGAVHAASITLAMIGSILLIAISARSNSRSEMTGLAIYNGCLLTMLVCSAAYNMTPPSKLKWLLRRFDHSAIYLLIAGTYTPLLVRLQDQKLAWILGGIIWTGAAVGIAIKVFFPGRFDRLAIVIYLMLGWAGVFAFGSFAAVLPPLTMYLILAGGLLYSAGVVFHVWESLMFQNAIWHGFVAVAAACHFAAMWVLYV